MRIVILRPDPGNGATAAKARSMGFDVMSLPLFVIESVEWSPPDPAAFDAVAMTSANAVRHAGRALDRYLHLPLFAVGTATADAAHTRGFADIVVGEGDAGDLAETMKGHEAARVLHLTGSDHRDLAGATALPVYRSAETAVDPAAFSAAVTDAIVLVHSPRAGGRLAALVAERSSIDVIAISPAALVACGAGWRRPHAADTPRDDAMLALARGLCEAATR